MAEPGRGPWNSLGGDSALHTYLLCLSATNPLTYWTFSYRSAHPSLIEPASLASNGLSAIVIRGNILGTMFGRFAHFLGIATVAAGYEMCFGDPVS